MTAFAVQVLAVGGAEVGHAVAAAAPWIAAGLGAALLALRWWLGRKSRITHLVFLPPAEVGDDVIAEFGPDAELEREIDDMVRRYGRG